MNLKNQYIKIYIIFYFIILITLNISFVYNIYHNYKNKVWKNDRGLFIYICIFDIFIDLYLILLSFIIYVLETIHILKLKIFVFFIIFGIDIKTKRTRLIFGLIQLLISCYYIQYNANTSTEMLILKTIFSTLYFLIGVINIILSVLNKFNVKIKNRDTIINSVNKDFENQY